MRACWTPPDAILEIEEAATRLPAGVGRTDPGVRVPRTFVPVDELVLTAPSAGGSAAASAAPSAAESATAAPGTGAGWSLWGDPEP